MDLDNSLFVGGGSQVLKREDLVRYEFSSKFHAGCCMDYSRDYSATMETLMTGKRLVLNRDAYEKFETFLKHALSETRIQETPLASERERTPTPTGNDDFESGDSSTQMTFNHGKQ